MVIDNFNHADKVFLIFYDEFLISDNCNGIESRKYNRENNTKRHYEDYYGIHGIEGYSPKKDSFSNAKA